jgi:glycine cleavage system regulatory protein
MTLILEPIIWSNGYSPPDDYYLIKQGQRIGRVSRMKTAMELWCWIPTGPRPSDAKPGGVAHSLDEAEAAVEAAWERRVRGPQGIISMRWADKFVIALLAIAAIVAAIVVVNLFGYPTTTERAGAAIGFFIGGAALFVLPLWLILRIAVWVTRASGVEGAGGLPASLALDSLVHREDAMTPRLIAGIKASVQWGITLVDSALTKLPGHVEAVTKPTVRWGTNLLNATLPKLLGHVEAAIKASVQWGITLVDSALTKLPGHVEAVTKPTVLWGTNLLNATLPKLLGHAEAAIKATVQRGITLVDSALTKLPGHVEAVTKPTVQWGTNLFNATLPKLLGHVEAAIKASVQWGTNLRRRSS